MNTENKNLTKIGESMTNNQNPPEGYTLFHTVDMMKDKKLFWKLNVAVLLFSGLLLALAVPLVLFVPFFRMTFAEFIERGMLFLLLFFAGQVLVIILHELIHAAVMKLYCKDVKIGLKVPFAYASCNGYLSRDSYLMVAVMPFVLISCGLLVTMFMFTPFVNLLLYLMFAIHTPSCLGDLYMLYILKNHPSNTLILDRGVDMDIFHKDS